MVQSYFYYNHYWSYCIFLARNLISGGTINGPIILLLQSLLITLYFLCKKCNLWRYYQWSNHTFLFLLGLEKVIKILQKVYYPSLSAVSTFYNATSSFYDTNSIFQNHLYMAKHSNGYPKLKFPKRRQSICIGSLHYEANMKNEEGMCSMNNISQTVHKVS